MLTTCEGIKYTESKQNYKRVNKRVNWRIQVVQSPNRKEEIILLVKGSHSNVLNHFQDFPGHFLPKNMEGISNFKEMEQQSSFQIPINLSFLKLINFQDFPGHFLSFPGLSRKWEPCNYFCAVGQS